MSSRTIALIAIIVSSVLWSTAGVTAKILLKTFEPFPLAFWRFVFASLIVLPLLLRNKNLEWRRITKEILPIALLSTANITLFYFGLKTTTSNATAIIYTATPLVTVLLARKFIQEQMTPKKIIGILVGLVGVLFITLLPLFEGKQAVTGDFMGNFLIFIAVFTWAGYTVGSRHLIEKRGHSPTVITSVSILVSTVVFLLITLLFSQKDFVTPIFEPFNFLLILNLALLVTVATYFLFQWSIKHSSATTASLTTYLQPVFAVWLNILILGEQINLEFVLGSLLVIGGVFIATGTRLLQEIKKIGSVL